MKQLNRILRLLGIFFALAAAGGAVSCSDLIYDEEEDCTQIYRITFNYDMNMKFANAFPAECNSVALYVFDNDGMYLKTYTTTVEELKNTDYYLTLDLEPGSYKFISWCGLNEEHNSIEIASMTAGTSTYTELLARIKRTNGVSSLVDNLYYGSLDATLPDEVGVHDYEIHLMKNTNTFNVILQAADEASIDDEYNIYITAENGYMNWDNSLLDDDVLTFKPTRRVYADADAEINDEPTTIAAYGVSINTGRIMSSFGNEFVIHIETSSGENIYTVPLTMYLDMFWQLSAQKDIPSFQEYLDRQDTYNIVFFLVGGNKIGSYIYINKYKLVLIDEELHS
jgi:hypothetical protein